MMHEEQQQRKSCQRVDNLDAKCVVLSPLQLECPMGRGRAGGGKKCFVLGRRAVKA